MKSVNKESVKKKGILQWMYLGRICSFYMSLVQNAHLKNVICFVTEASRIFSKGTRIPACLA